MTVRALAPIATLAAGKACWRWTFCSLAWLAMSTPTPAQPSVAAAPTTAAASAPASAPATPEADDPFLWLEDVQGERALAWVRERNAATRQRLQAWPHFDTTRNDIRAVLDSRERIPDVVRRGDHLYNFWQDAEHPRGLWRRTTLAEYRRAAPAWELLLDVDELGRQEKESWVWAGAECLDTDPSRCLVMLSRGGGDAAVVREFDLTARRFIAPPEGFALPEAKSDVSWLDRDTLFVGTDFGPGSLTDSGYPRVVKRWRRGTPLEAATTVFEGQRADVAVRASVDHTPGHERVLFSRAVDFYNNELSLWREGALQRLPKPSDASVSFWYGHVLMELRSDWAVEGTTWPKGSLLVSPVQAYLAGQARWTALFTPTATQSLAGYTTTRRHVLVSTLQDVAGRVNEWHFNAAEGRWTGRAVDAPFPGALGVASWHDPMVKDDALGESYALSYADFLTPDTLALARTGSDERETLKQRPRFFSSEGMRVEQHFATSADGTRVPYFVVWPPGAKADGRNPTLLYGYGGFEQSLTPWYSGVFGRAWFSRGGVLVVANIRGGGEYGPAWHQAALKENKQKSYDDFAAVAEDLLRRQVTSAAHLGIEGGSNGGLLVGAVMLQRPELLGAVVCQVPLLDMRRYHRLLAGASWMAEYGDPDQPEQWAHISRYSPYQNVPPAPGAVGGRQLPAVLFTTSTRDDRVHPGHARKMAARMLQLGHPVLYYENIEGGHGGAADNAQRADMSALEFAFLWQRLGGQIGAAN